MCWQVMLFVPLCGQGLLGGDGQAVSIEDLHRQATQVAALGWADHQSIHSLLQMRCEAFMGELSSCAPR